MTARPTILHLSKHGPSLTYKRTPRWHLACPARTHFADHHEPGMHTKTDTELDTEFLGKVSIQQRDRLDNTEPGTHRALGVVLMCAREAGIERATISKGTSQMAIVAVDTRRMLPDRRAVDGAAVQDRGCWRER